MQSLKITLLLICLTASFATVGWMRSGFNQVADEPTIDLAAIPYQLGPWRGQDGTTMPEEVQEALRADGVVNRSYENPNGEQISMHAAAWINREFVNSGPHHPEVCYPAAGSTIVDRHAVEIPLANGTISAELIHFQQDYRDVVTCHWFQMDDYSYRSAREFERSRFYGSKTWPNTFKVLLSTPGDSVEDAEPKLLDFATHVHQAMAELRATQQTVKSENLVLIGP